ncbi:hypothetical protein CC78DRAFT_293816 [Lojkania enalia]|uniref:Uncharacterized protein n=1 Tax=Lojkania enalia TaxID=147567 RepID=A0A9P4K4Y9_9PLEO|nr:hypothetical protein CC78DRAFT_293816 [Didymosphaeria enalia]
MFYQNDHAPAPRLLQRPYPARPSIFDLTPPSPPLFIEALSSPLLCFSTTYFCHCHCHYHYHYHYHENSHSCCCCSSSSSSSSSSSYYYCLHHYCSCRRASTRPPSQPPLPGRKPPAIGLPLPAYLLAQQQHTVNKACSTLLA